MSFYAMLMGDRGAYMRAHSKEMREAAKEMQGGDPSDLKAAQAEATDAAGERWDRPFFGMF